MAIRRLWPEPEIPLGRRRSRLRREIHRGGQIPRQPENPGGALRHVGKRLRVDSVDTDGYGDKIADKYSPSVTMWLGESYKPEAASPRQDYWGYTDLPLTRSDTWGFRIVFIPQR